MAFYTDLAAAFFAVSWSLADQDFFLGGLLIVGMEVAGLSKSTWVVILEDVDGPAMDDGVETTN